MSQPHDFPFDITDVAELLHLRIRRPSPQGLYVDTAAPHSVHG